EVFVAIDEEAGHAVGLAVDQATDRLSAAPRDRGVERLRPDPVPCHRQTTCIYTQSDRRGERRPQRRPEDPPTLVTNLDVVGRALGRRKDIGAVDPRQPSLDARRAARADGDPSGRTFLHTHTLPPAGLCTFATRRAGDP